jgi:hypothetical protein
MSARQTPLRLAAWQGENAGIDASRLRACEASPGANMLEATKARTACQGEFIHDESPLAKMPSRAATRFSTLVDSFERARSKGAIEWLTQ